MQKSIQTQREKEEEEISEKQRQRLEGFDGAPDKADVPLKRLRLLENLWSIE